MPGSPETCPATRNVGVTTDDATARKRARFPFAGELVFFFFRAAVFSFEGKSDDATPPETRGTEKTCSRCSQSLKSR